LQFASLLYAQIVSFAATCIYCEVVARDLGVDMPGKRRTNGEGSVFQRGDGRWVASITVGFDENGKQRRRTVTGKTATGVCKRIAQVRKELNGPKLDDKTTVSDLIDRWLTDVVHHRVAVRGYESYESVARIHIKPALGTKPVVKLTVADVDGLLSAKLNADFSGSTVTRIRGVLSMALDQGVRWDLIPRNVASLSAAPRMNREEKRTLTPEQAKLLIVSLRGQRWEALYLTMLYLGLRRGEVLGLKWEDIDFDSAVLTVRRALQRVGGRLETTDVKTAKSRRSLNLPGVIVDSLRTHKARQAADRLKAGEVWQETGFAFTTRIGTPLEPRNLNRHLSTVTEKAGLGHWHPHELRHSAASLMMAAGIPVEVVRDVLGHSSIRMTADVYGHIMPPQRQDAAARMAGYLGDSTALG
jgi:integrase